MPLGVVNGAAVNAAVVNGSYPTLYGALSTTQADDSVSASAGLLTVVQGAGLFRPIRSANTAVVVGSIVAGWDVVVLPPTSVIHIPVSTPYTAGRLLTSGEVLAPYFGLSTPVCRSAIVFKSKVSRPVAASNSPLVGGFVYSSQVSNAVGPRCGATVAIVSGRVYSGGNVVRPRAIRNPTMEQMMALFS